MIGNPLDSILRGDDPTLQADTHALYLELFERLGCEKFSEIIELDYPMLLKPKTSLLQTWWLLSNIADAWLTTTPAAEVVTGLRGKLGAPGDPQNMGSELPVNA